MNEFSLKRTKVVATIGPASREPATLRALLLAGVNVVPAELLARHARGARRARSTTCAGIVAELGMHVALLQDLPGPKVRTGKLAGGVDAVIARQRRALHADDR